MIFFEHDFTLTSFMSKNLPKKIAQELLYRKPTEEEKQQGIDDFVSKQYKPHPTLINDLIKMGLVCEWKEATGYQGKLETKGYVLMWSKIQNLLVEDFDDLINYDRHRLLSINEAAAFLSASRSTVYQLIREKKIPVVILYKTTKIQKSDLIKYIDRQKVE